MFQRKPLMDRAEVWVRWNHAMGVPITVASAGAAADQLVAEGLAWRDGDALRPLLSPQLRRHSPLALDEHFRAVRAILWSLERGGKYQVAKIAAAATLSESVTEAALAVLTEAGLITVRGGQVASAVTPPRRTAPVEWSALAARPVPTAAPPPPMQPTPPAAAPKPPLPAPKPSPAPTVAVPKPAAADPEPTPQPKPAPKPEPPVRVTSRTMAAAIAKPAPAAALADEDDEDSATLLRRLVHAAEVSAGIAAAPTRVRTPLNSPLQDCQVRLCVVLAGSDRPLLRSEISRLSLSREQLPFLIPALLDGCRRGAFNRVGGAGKSGKGARFSLVDPSVFGVSDESVAAAVEAQRAERERRRDRARRKHELGSAAVPAG